MSKTYTEKNEATESSWEPVLCIDDTVRAPGPGRVQNLAGLQAVQLGKTVCLIFTLS